MDRNSTLSGRILKISQSHGSIYITMENKRQVLIPKSLNYEYNPKGFHEIASRGDSIIKRYCDDTLYLITKESRVYIFNIKDELNIDLSPLYKQLK